MMISINMSTCVHDVTNICLQLTAEDFFKATDMQTLKVAICSLNMTILINHLLTDIGCRVEV